MGATMYGTAIQEAIVSGDLRAMKLLAREAEKHIKEWGDMSTSLALLKLEIAKAQAPKKARKTK
jgi:Domain of unknown function (DUF1843)